MMKAADVSLQKDKPIMLSFWKDSLEKTVFILHNKKENEFNLYKNEDEFTSPFEENGRYSVERGEMICETANSLYIVSSEISTRVC